jgi:hypothetical protein
MKICLYTCIFGDYENLNNHIKFDNLDYILFTDNKELKSDLWKIIYIENTEKVPPAIFYKKIKSFPNIYLSEYDLTIWLDANFIIKNDIFLDYILDNFKDNKILLYKHYCMAGFHRDCAYTEGEYSKTIPKYKNEKIDEQLNNYKNDVFPEHFGLFQSGFLLRNNRDEEVINFNTLWYDEIIKYSVKTPQCQISLPYVLWKTKIKFNTLKGIMWDFNIFTINNHKHTTY